MADEAKPQGNVSKMYKYFGAKQGQNLQEFAKELKELTENDKAQLVQGIDDGSLTY